MNPSFIKSKIKYNMNFALMKKGYLKSAHLDRRDHLISGIYYPTSKKNKGGIYNYVKLKEEKNF